tara:strand:- start:7984 stop:8271 length:288 start_codon:yes stop_codon:yes gene_type:complete
MAYSADGLVKLSAGGGFNVYFYRSLDTAATINTAAYFNSAVNFLNVGDLIIQQQVGGTVAVPTSVTAGTLMWVLSNNGTAVDVSDGTAIVVTDSD